MTLLLVEHSRGGWARVRDKSPDDRDRQLFELVLEVVALRYLLNDRGERGEFSPEVERFLDAYNSFLEGAASDPPA